MPDFRVHAPAASPAAAEIRLGAEESHHLVVVNRCQQGDPVVAFDGKGREWSCVCETPAKSAAVLRVRDFRQAPPLFGQLTLAQALPKGSTMDEIVRQATELGAARLVPLVTERTQVHLDDDRADKKVEKWRVTATEAAKQCGNPWLPEITRFTKLTELLAARATSAPATAPIAAGGGGDHLASYDLALVASLHVGAQSLKAVIAERRAKLGRMPERILWLVGPEGDFSPAEMQAMTAAGVVPVTLGSLVLRCDTAAIAALSILRHEISE